MFLFLLSVVLVIFCDCCSLLNELMDFLFDLVLVPVDVDVVVDCYCAVVVAGGYYLFVSCCFCLSGIKVVENKFRTIL